MRDVEAAYLAGLLDGEGSYMIGRSVVRDLPTWHATIAMSTTDDVLAFLCHELAGGSVSGPTRPKSPNASPAWIWAIKGRPIGPLIEELWPYIALKRPQAALLHRLRSLITSGAKPGVKGRTALTQSERYQRETMRLACKALNRRGTGPLPEQQLLALESAKLLDLIRPPRTGSGDSSPDRAPASS